VIGEKPDGSNPFDAKLDRYAAVTLQVARETGATPVNVRKAFLDYLAAHNTEKDEQGRFAAKGILTYDGVHMSDKGNDLLADLLSGAIAEALDRARPRSDGIVAISLREMQPPTLRRRMPRDHPPGLDHEMPKGRKHERQAKMGIKVTPAKLTAFIIEFEP